MPTTNGCFLECGAGHLHDAVLFEGVKGARGEAAGPGVPGRKGAMGEPGIPGPAGTTYFHLGFCHKTKHFNTLSHASNCFNHSHLYLTAFKSTLLCMMIVKYLTCLFS